MCNIYSHYSRYFNKFAFSLISILYYNTTVVLSVIIHVIVSSLCDAAVILMPNTIITM